MRRVSLSVMIALVFGLYTLPLIAAPPASKVLRIGYLSLGRPTPDAPTHAAFRQGLRELGYADQVIQ